MAIKEKNLKITAEQSTLTLASYHNLEIEVFPLPKGKLTEIDGWGYVIRDLNDSSFVKEDETTLYSSSRIALISAMTAIMQRKIS